MRALLDDVGEVTANMETGLPAPYKSRGRIPRLHVSKVWNFSQRRVPVIGKFVTLAGTCFLSG